MKEVGPQPGLSAPLKTELAGKKLASDASIIENNAR